MKRWDRAAEELKKAHVARAAAIMVRVRKGESIAAIARDMDMTRQRVSQIVNKQREAGVST